MKFDILTLFPEMFEAVKQSVIGKAIEKQLIQINLINIRDFSKDKRRRYTIWWWSRNGNDARRSI